MPSGKLKRTNGLFRGQAVDANGFSRQRDIVLRARRVTPLRWATVTLAAISWLAISNHCALGRAASESHETEALAEHDCCAGELPAKPKPAGNPNAPCCKTLRATMALAKSFRAGEVRLAGAPVEFPPALLDKPRTFHLARRSLDTGPPGTSSFAESVLQRSLLAHAPPFVA
jgi:hypothetical protein